MGVQKNFTQKNSLAPISLSYELKLVFKDDRGPQMDPRNVRHEVGCCLR